MCHKICPISICIYYLQIIGIYLNTFEKIKSGVFEMDQSIPRIAQDLINKGIDFKPDQFVKVINGIMLRIL